MNVIHRPSWAIPEREVTPEAVFLNRRRFLAASAAAGGAVLALGTPSGVQAAVPEDPYIPVPARNPAYADAGRPVTAEEVNASYNNFYEFGSHKNIARKAQALQTEDWTLEIGGMVEQPMTLAVDDLLKRVTVEERIYRHRCVEAWAMVVPWIGFPVKDLLALAKPLSGARYMRLQTFYDPEVARGQRQRWQPWPYTEGVSMEEAANDLAFLVVGAYGKVLHKQFGAPIRLHLPWKYGFKSIKSISSIEFVEERPVGYWESLARGEYGFWANVNPEVAHPRWSQASERMLGTDERVPTLLFNGYGEQVASLYEGMEEQFGKRLWR